MLEIFFVGTSPESKGVFSELTGYNIDHTGDVSNSLSVVKAMTKEANSKVIVIYNNGNGIGMHASVIDRMSYNPTTNSVKIRIMDPNGGVFRNMKKGEVSSIVGFINVSK